MVWVTAGISGAVLVGVVQTPGVSQFFGCTPLDPAAWVVVGVSAGLATVGSVAVPRLLAFGDHGSVIASRVSALSPRLLRNLLA